MTILIDNEDKEYIEIDGEWETVNRYCYGQTMLRTKSGQGSVKFISTIPRIGR
jgi:hypothetical protein